MHLKPEVAVESDELYLSYSRYLKNRYGGAAFRVAVDAGFTCPHRTDGNGGCAFCGAAGGRAAYTPPGASLEEQITRRVNVLRRRGVENLLLYLQANTNTYAEKPVLKELYDRALSLAPPLLPFKELIVATRPDCLDRERVDLLASYRTPEREVWVELGLQSAENKTLERINRGHDLASYQRAHRMLREAGIKVAVHLILGLPGEGWNEIGKSVRTVAAEKADGVKFHNLILSPGTLLHKEYTAGSEEIYPIDEERYLTYLERALELLPPDCVVIRINTDAGGHGGKRSVGITTPKSLLRERLLNRMRAHGAYQGKRWSGKIGFENGRESQA